MKRILVAVAAAGAAFVAVGAPTGVLAMADPGYCFDHPRRPATATSHEESLSFFPPGPVCTFAAPGGEVTAGPGWWPATAAGAAALAGVAAVRLSR